MKRKKVKGHALKWAFKKIPNTRENSQQNKHLLDQFCPKEINNLTKTLCGLNTQ